MSTPPISPLPRSMMIETSVTCPQCGHHFVPALSGSSSPAEPPQILDEQLLRKSLSASVNQSVQTVSSNPSEIPTNVSPQSSQLTLFDHVLIGGRFTVFCLCYGDYFDLHQRCLDSILQHTPLDRIELRVAANQIGDRSRQYLSTLPIRKIYWDEGQRRKYSAMREMFWDDSCPISTPWVIWLDDDSFVIHTNWLSALAGEIIRLSSQDHRLGMLGKRYYHVLKKLPGSQPDYPWGWFRSANWHRGRPMSDFRRREAPYGNVIHFLAGSFWALRTEALRECDIPDRRLDHHGGDIVLGEQLWQNRWSIADFDQTGRLVKLSAAPPRGCSLPGNSAEKQRSLPWYQAG